MKGVPNIMEFILLLITITAVNLVNSEKRYDGYKLYNIEKPKDPKMYNVILELKKKFPDIDFWNDPSPLRKVDVMAPPESCSEMENFLSKSGVDFNVTMNNVQTIVDREKLRRHHRQNEEMGWDEYHRLAVIYGWMDQLAEYYSKKVRVTSIGTSSEGRPIKMMVLSSNPFKRNPIIYIDGGMHAREWISPSVVTYIMGKLLTIEDSSNDAKLISDIDWYIVPVANPDGYEYTHTEDRLWRKSRSKNSADPDCVGVDLNRNFDFHWGEVGVSENPCGNTYPGPFPFSEPEANATARVLWRNRNRIKAYLTFHSYSQLWLTPYGYTEDLPDDYDDMYDLGVEATNALEDVHGTVYEVGPPSHILYENSGSSRDWAKGVPDIKYSATIELRDEGQNGFILPPEEIEETCEETWEAVVVRFSGSSQDFANGFASIKYAYTIELRDDGDHKFLLPESQIFETGEETWEAVKIVAKKIYELKKQEGEKFKESPIITKVKKSASQKSLPDF